MWLFSTDGFISVVEFDPPKVVIKSATYGKTAEGKTNYADPITAAVYGEDTIDQHLVEQLVNYTPATKDNLSSHLLVRARVEADLAPLKEADPDAVFFEDKSADYQFRCIIARHLLAGYAAAQVMSIDYSSHVKEEMNRRAPQVEGGRMTAHSAIWSAMAKLQPNPPYGHTYGTMYGHSYGSSVSSVGTAGTYTGKYGGFYQTSGFGVKKDPKDTAVSGSLAYGTGEVATYSDDPELDKILAEWDYDSSEWLEYEEDDPAEGMTDLEIAVACGDISSDTMRLQLREILIEANLLDTFDLDNAVDALTDSFGTCDIFKLEAAEVFSVLDTLSTSNSI